VLQLYDWPIPVMPAAMLMMSVLLFMPGRASVSTCCTY
jgi:hypothetical protein